LTRQVLPLLLPCLAAACGAQPADGPATALRILSEHDLDGIDEPSGLSFANGRLYAVSDRRADVYVLSADGRVTDTRPLDLPAEEREGLEGIAVDGSTALVAREDSGEVLRADVTSGQLRSRSSVPDAVDGNDGLEGLCVRPDDGHVFAVKEKRPVRLLHLTPDGQEVARVKLSSLASDLSGLTWLCDGRLLAVSQEDRTLHELSDTGEPRRSWEVPTAHAEGIAFDGSGRLYLVDEEEERLLVFELDPGCG